MKKHLINTIKIFSYNFTLGKFMGALLTALIIAALKYYISGSLHIEYCEFWNNVGIVLLAWTLNTGLIALFTEYLGIKGFNINIKELIYGFDTMDKGSTSEHVHMSKEFKPKLYCAMDSEYEAGSKDRIDKGKGVDKDSHPNYDRGMGIKSESLSPENKSIVRTKVKVVLDSPVPAEPHMVTWSRIFPGVDPASILPKRTNTGPGFNVPGGEVPIRDEICQHIDYNTHILSQFKKMDLETATEQRNNNLIFVQVLETKINYANGVLSKIPTIPTTEHEFKLKNQILRDLNNLSRDKIRAEARATLLSSRIQFIEGQVNRG